MNRVTTVIAMIAAASQEGAAIEQRVRNGALAAFEANVDALPADKRAMAMMLQKCHCDTLRELDIVARAREQALRDTLALVVLALPAPLQAEHAEALAAALDHFHTAQQNATDETSEISDRIDRSISWAERRAAQA